MEKLLGAALVISVLGMLFWKTFQKVGWQLGMALVATFLLGLILLT